MKTLKTILQEVISGIKAWVNSNFAQESNTVHKTGNETVDGLKKFTAESYFQSGVVLTSPTGVDISQSSYGSEINLGTAVFLDGNIRWWGRLQHNITTEGDSIIELSNSNFKTNGAQGVWRIYFASKKDFSDVSFYPWINNSINLGKPDRQWHNVCAKNYYYDGTAWGLDKANEWTADQTIAANRFLRVYGYRFQVKNASMELGTVPSSNQWTGMQFVDKSNTAISEIVQSFQSNGNAIFQINVWPNEENSVKNSVISYVYNSANSVNNLTVSSNFLPWNNTLNLGNSSSKWKTINGINPGALSLPNLEYSDSNKWIDIKPAITNTAGSDNWYYPAVDGWVFIIASGGAAPDLNVLVFIASGLNFISGAVPAAESSTGARWCQCLAPAGSRVRIRFNKGSTSCIIEKALFIPCQGNV